MMMKKRHGQFSQEIIHKFRYISDMCPYNFEIQQEIRIFSRFSEVDMICQDASVMDEKEGENAPNRRLKELNPMFGDEMRLGAGV